MKYLEKSFSVGMTGNKKYEENYDRIFGKKEKPEEAVPEETTWGTIWSMIINKLFMG